MAGLDLAQLERLLYLFVGVVFLILVGLIVYVVISRRRAEAAQAPLFAAPTASDPRPLVTPPTPSSTCRLPRHARAGSATLEAP